MKLVSGECRGREEETGVCEEFPRVNFDGTVGPAMGRNPLNDGVLMGKSSIDLLVLSREWMGMGEWDYYQ